MAAFGPYPGVVTDWHDGDTCHVNIDLGFAVALYGHDIAGHAQMSCRVAGINAPELSTLAGKAALLYVEGICPNGTLVKILSLGWDKYGRRFDGKITLPDGTDIATLMLSSGHAVVMA